MHSAAVPPVSPVFCLTFTSPSVWFCHSISVSSLILSTQQSFSHIAPKPPPSQEPPPLQSSAMHYNFSNLKEPEILHTVCHCNSLYLISWRSTTNCVQVSESISVYSFQPSASVIKTLWCTRHFLATLAACLELGRHSLKYLNNSWIMCHEILYRHSWPLGNEAYWFWW